MDDAVIATHLENLDRRLSVVEQILPTLATKGELREAIASAVAPLATKEELREAIASAVAPLATNDELERSTRRLEILIEAQHDDVRLLAEAVAGPLSKRDTPG